MDKNTLQLEMGYRKIGVQKLLDEIDLDEKTEVENLNIILKIIRRMFKIVYIKGRLDR